MYCGFAAFSAEMSMLPTAEYGVPSSNVWRMLVFSVPATAGMGMSYPSHARTR